MKVLITGFDPFGGEKINPALEAVKLLPETIEGAEVIKLEIPTVFRKSLAKIEEAIEKHNPDIVISVGQAGGRFRSRKQHGCKRGGYGRRGSGELHP